VVCKISADNSQKKRVTKQLFSPVSVSSESYLTNSEKVTADLASLLLTAVPDSCFVQLYTAKPFPKKSPQHLPETVIDVFARLPCTSFEEKLAALSVTDVDITALCEATVSQRDSDVWVQQRVGRITATNCHAVFTRMATVANKPDVNCNRLVNEVLGLTKKCQTAAMKHGIAMEPHAARQYSAVMKMKHAKFRTYKAGLILCKSDPYLAASPDLFVNCECHSRGLCEIKSPYKTRHLVPAHTHIKYLENVGGHSKLTRNSDYYFQVQAQMGVTGLKYCDFFVYTMHGYHLERIEFDEELWDVIRSRSLQFWRYYVVPKIEQSVLIMPVNEPSVTSETDTADSDISDNEATDVVDHGYCQPPVKKLRACPLKLPPYPPVCLCGVCHATCISDDAHFSADSIQCSGCLLWFHHTCVNVMSADDTWLCDICITEQY
jgi:hypothetical protein